MKALRSIGKELYAHKMLYAMMIPILAFYIIFHYAPMYGAQIAFRNYRPRDGFLGSEWVGLENFKNFFGSIYAPRVIRNTILLSLFSLLWGFPMPILLALLLNEIRSNGYKRTVQTLTYLPHFVSLVVVCGMVTDFVSSGGIINDLVEALGLPRANFLLEAKYFRTVYIASGIWQEIGWGSIIYLAAMTGVDQQLYEAATIDGAGKLRQVTAVTLPSILPTIVILLILRVGSIMNVGFEKVFLLYNPANMDTADVISTYSYRRGLIDQDYSFSTAVGLFNSVINFALIVTTNKISNKLTETGLW